MRSPSRACAGRLAATAAIVAWTAAAGAAQPPAPDPYARCREGLARGRHDHDTAYCFYQVTFDKRLWDDGARVFDELIARDPTNIWLVLAYGHLYLSREPDRAEAMYRRSAAAFREAGDIAGEVAARTSLANVLRPRGRVDEARQEVERAIALGADSHDPLVKVQAWIGEAAHLQQTGGDVGAAYRLLKRAQEADAAGLPYRVERSLLVSLGAAAFLMGRLDEALTIYGRLEALAMEIGDALLLATARYNILNTSAAKETLLPTPGARERLTSMAERSLATAIDAQNVNATLKSRVELARLLARDERSRARALEHVQDCLDLAVRARRPQDEAVCSWLRASIVRDQALQDDGAAERRAIEATARVGDPETQAYSASQHMRLSWRTRPRDQAVRDSLAAIGTVETLRALQNDPNSSAALFSAWTLDYYWLSGRLLQDARKDELALAFSITERMRARSLLDVLDRSRPIRDPRDPAVRERRALLEAIAAVQRVLMDPTLDVQRRGARLRELEGLEHREQDAQRQTALASPDARRGPPTFARLDAVQSALSEHEALLSFQVGLWQTYDGDFGGGSWLIAVTRDRTTVHRLPDRVRLTTVVPVFVGLLEGGQGGEAPAAVHLYRELLADAIDALPRDITRLVIVADGALHHLPFEALRAAPEAPPIGARYEVVQAPSATLWLQWRARAPRAPAGRMLTLADPVLIGGVESGAQARNATLLQGLRIGRLPHAREESRAIARHVRGVETLIGEGASEQALKARDLGAYDILHLAAHAVADEAHPERSAVLLAPGDAREDGLLQVREIEALDLEGRIVVLSACHTAAGAVLSGEGVLSLARAFFEAGAHAVVGSRWPLRDVDAAAFFDAFYRQLGRGASLSEALTDARNDARAAGRPASAWAGLVLLGNGDLRPFAGRQPSADRWPWLVLPLAAGLALLIVLGRRSKLRLYQSKLRLY